MYFNDSRKSSINNVTPSASSAPRAEKKPLRRHSSSRTVVSNASSTRTHRRSRVEVGSMIFGNVVPASSSSNGLHATIPMHRQKSEPLPIKQMYGMHSHLSSSSEHRAPDEDSAPSSSSCTRVCVASSDRASSSSMATLKQEKDMATICCTVSKEEDGSVDETVRALELIRKLSFDTGDASNAVPNRGQNPNVSSVSVCSAPTIMAVPHVLHTDYSSPPRRDRSEGDANLATPPPGLPLPPRIQRMEDSHSVVSLPDHIPQVMHNRNRLRSTSLSEMSDSCRLGFADKEDYDGDNEEMEDQADATSLNSSSKSNDGEDEGKVVLSTIDDIFPSETIALSPPLHPSAGPRAPILNRGRTSTMTSDLSSYLSPSSSSSSSSSDCASDDDVSKEYSISSYEEELQGLDDPPGFYEGDFRSESWHREDGYLSLPECTGPYATTWEHSAHSANHGVTPHRLSSEALREWNKLCEEEEYPEVMATKHQHIWRALSCPDIQATVGHCDRVEVVNNPTKVEDHVDDVRTHLIANYEDEEDELNQGERAFSPEVLPHLMADGVVDDLPMSHAPSRSIFSYTNSYSPSTISSGLSDVDEISHLDFDITFVYPREIEVANNPDLAHISAVPKKGKHRRSRSSMGLSKPLNAKKTFAGNKRRHRRHKSDNILVDQAASSTDIAFPNKKQQQLLSLTDIAEDVKSLSNSSIINSNDHNLLNILSQSLETDEMNVSSMRGSIESVWGSHREKICWFTLGCCLGMSVQYLFQPK